MVLCVHYELLCKRKEAWNFRWTQKTLRKVCLIILKFLRALHVPSMKPCYIDMLKLSSVLFNCLRCRGSPFDGFLS